MLKNMTAVRRPITANKLTLLLVVARRAVNSAFSGSQPILITLSGGVCLYEAQFSPSPIVSPKVHQRQVSAFLSAYKLHTKGSGSLIPKPGRIGEGGKKTVTRGVALITCHAAPGAVNKAGGDRNSSGAYVSLAEEVKLSPLTTRLSCYQRSASSVGVPAAAWEEIASFAPATPVRDVSLEGAPAASGAASVGILTCYALVVKEWACHPHLVEICLRFGQNCLSCWESKSVAHFTRHYNLYKIKKRRLVSSFGEHYLCKRDLLPVGER